jgi:hypothetical protein
VFENVVVFALHGPLAARAAESLDGASRTNHFEEDSSAVNGFFDISSR